MSGTIIKNNTTYGVSINDSQPVGQVITSASDNTPAGYLPCDGRSLLRSDYPDLFKKIGTKYGALDDEHFNLPTESDMLINDQTTSDTQTWSSQKISSMLNYSTEEQIAGKWIDGRTIYKKTIMHTKEAGSNSEIISYNASPTNVIKFEGICFGIPGYEYTFKLDGAWTNDYSEIGEWQYVAYTNVDRGNIELRCGASAKNSKINVYITVWYTKD